MLLFRSVNYNFLHLHNDAQRDFHRLKTWRPALLESLLLNLTSLNFLARGHFVPISRKQRAHILALGPATASRHVYQLHLQGCGDCTEFGILLPQYPNPRPQIWAR